MNVELFFKSRDGIEQKVKSEITKVKSNNGKDVVLIEDEDFLVRLYPIEKEPTGQVQMKYLANIISKDTLVKVTLPVKEIIEGEHQGELLIGQRSKNSVERALVVNGYGENQFDSVTIPYDNFNKIKAMINYAHLVFTSKSNSTTIDNSASTDVLPTLL